jgi:hypothetical protein
MNLTLSVALLALVANCVTRERWAWGATGHEWVSGIAIEKLPDIIPEFVRAPEAAAEIAVMGRELDRSRGAGKTHDAERDPGHYVNPTDDGAVLGVVPLAQPPATRASTRIPPAACIWCWGRCRSSRKGFPFVQRLQQVSTCCASSSHSRPIGARSWPGQGE